MTSPQAATKEVVAAMASTEISHDDNPRPNLELHQVTAVNAEEDAPKNDHDSRERSATLLPEVPQENKELATVEEHAGDVQTQNGSMHLTMEAAIPDGANLIQDTQSGFPPMSTLDMDADTLNVLMMMNGGRFYDPAINGLVGTVPMPPQMDGASQHQPYLDPSPYLHENDETRISAYAKVEFADGEFYMNTHQIILGRDLAAAQAAQRRDRMAEQIVLEEERNEERKAAEPKTPIRINREGSRHGKSVISDSGGILMEGDDYDSDERARRKERRLRKSRKSTTGSSSQHVSMSRRSSLAMPDAHIVYHAQPQVRRAAPVTSGGVPVDLASLRPSPHDCPLVGIHPPASEPYSKYKAISRQHVKIAFNAKKHLFEAIIIGRNGAFIDDLFYHGDSVVPLKSGSSLQIGPVYMRFVLPDIAIGETGAEQRVEYEDSSLNGSRLESRCSAGGKEMSLEFDDDGRRNADSSDDESGQDQQVTLGEEGEEKEDENDLEGEEEEREQEEWEDMDADGEDEEETNGYTLAESVEEDNHQPIPSADVAHNGKPPKKRGPGRPPKNGVRSKREEQLAKKEALAQEKAKKTVPQQSETGKENKDGKVKNKVGRPRKHPRPDTPPIKTEKRKYTKRKPKEPADPNAPRQEGEGEEKKPKKEKPVKPPRSPTPQYDVDQLTEEQKSKPPQNYVQLIYDALRDSPTGQMSLPQIYRSMQRKYPYFVVSTTTSGWQSSVRHNLSQNSAFEKTQRDGKGWMWAIKEGATIEKEKKRQKTPPAPAYPQYQQPIYPGAPWFPQGQYPPGQYPIPVYGMQPNYGPGQIHPQYVQGPPPHMNGHPIPGPHPPMNVQPVNGQPIPGYPTPLPPQLTAPGPGLSAIPGGATYRSPYAPDPNPNTATSPPQPGGTQPQSDQQQPQPGGSQAPYQSQYPTAGTSSTQGPPPVQGMQIQPGTQGYPVSTSGQPNIQSNSPAPHTAPPTQGPSPHSTFGQPCTEGHSPAPLSNLPTQNLPENSSSGPAIAPHPQPSISVDSKIIQEFKSAMVEGLKAKTDNPEALVDSAINRVLGLSTESTVPGNHLETSIMDGLKQMLLRNHSNSKLAEQPTSQAQSKQQNPLIPGNDNGLYVKASQSPKPNEEKTGPTVMQPPLVGQAQSRPSVPRPPMMGMKRTNSDSQASSRLSQTPSASPAPTKDPTHGISISTVGIGNDSTQNTGQVSTPAIGSGDIMSTFETTQIIGQKRSLSDADDAREFKRECTSGLPTN